MDQASSLRKIVKKQAEGTLKKRMPNKAVNESGKRLPRVIAVTSGKGGVGKTNIVASLAVAFSKLDQRVLILDADLGLANIDIIFGVRPEYNISHVISGEKSLSEIIFEVRPQVRIIPAGSGFENLTALTEGQKLHLLSEFEALDGVADFVLIDTGAGISANVLYFNMAADDCVVIATHEPTSITDAYAMMKVMSTNHGMKRYKLLVNMVKDEGEAKQVYLTLSQAVDRFLKGTVLEYLGFIPQDEKLRAAVLSRKTVMEKYPEAPSSQRIFSQAKAFIDAPVPLDGGGNMKFFMQRFLHHLNPIRR